MSNLNLRSRQEDLLVSLETTLDKAAIHVGLSLGEEYGQRTIEMIRHHLDRVQESITVLLKVAEEFEKGSLEEQTLITLFQWS